MSQAKENAAMAAEPDKVESIQLTIDGADEVDPQFSLIKGGGACLLREKIIALRQKKDGSGPLITDGGHYILDSRCKKIPKPAETAHKLAQIPGVMEHGIFIDLADVIIIGETDHAKVMELARS